jgi:hypothetical protein
MRLRRRSLGKDNFSNSYNKTKRQKVLRTLRIPLKY